MVSDSKATAQRQASSSKDTSAKDASTLTKADLVERVHQKMGVSKKESAELVETIFENMKRTLEAGEHVKISGFGKFEVKEKHARRGRNPQTGGALEIPARRRLAFKPSQVLRAQLAGEAVDENTKD